MTNKRSFYAALIGAMIAWNTCGAVAQADPFSLLGPVSPGDTLALKYFSEEDFVETAGDNLFGVIYVSSIDDVTKGTTVWAQGLGGQGQIAGIFNNYVSEGTTGTAPLFTENFSGGNITLNYNPTVVHTVNGQPMGTNANPDPSGTYLPAGSTLWASIIGIPGILPGDPTTTLNSTFNSLTSPLTGTGNGNIKLTGGIAVTLFGVNALGLFRSDFKAPSTTTGTPWPVNNSDPATFEVVPEPSSMVLMSMGLLSLLGISRKRRRHVVE